MTFNSLIDLAELVQDISKVVLKSAFVIKEISQNLNQIFYKDEKLDPVTEADYLVQKTITDFLLSKYPALRIIGEENIDADDEITKKVAQKSPTMNFAQIDPHKMVEQYPVPKNTLLFPVSEICLWIDPLDCTRGFISNKKQQVTILVGVTLNHRPIAGIIGQPFKLDSSKKCIFNPRIFLGSELFVQANQTKYCYEYHYFNKSWKKWEQYNPNQHGHTERKVAVSSRRIPLKQHQLMDKVKMEKHEIGGAGSKFIKLIKKEVGNLMFIDAKTSKWDSCAGQAIVKAMGGFSIKPNLQEIVYDPNQEYANNEGFIVSLSQNVFNEIENYISSEQFQKLSVMASKQVGLIGN